MDDLFLLLFFASTIALVVGLVKPTAFTRFLKEKATRKDVATIFGIAAIAFFVLFAITTEPTTQTPQVAQENNVPEDTEQITKSDNEQVENQKEIVDTKQDIQKTETPKEDTILKETKTTPTT